MRSVLITNVVKETSKDDLIANVLKEAIKDDFASADDDWASVDRLLDNIALTNEDYLPSFESWKKGKINQNKLGTAISKHS